MAFENLPQLPPRRAVQNQGLHRRQTQFQGWSITQRRQEQGPQKSCARPSCGAIDGKKQGAFAPTVPRRCQQFEVLDGLATQLHLPSYLKRFRALQQTIGARTHLGQVLAQQAHGEIADRR